MSLKKNLWRCHTLRCIFFSWSQQASYLSLMSTISLVTSLVCWSFVNPRALLQQGWSCVLRHLWTRGAGRDHGAFHWSECSQPMQEHWTWGNYFHISPPCQGIFEGLYTGEGVPTLEKVSLPWFYHLCGIRKKKEREREWEPRTEDCSNEIN